MLATRLIERHGCAWVIQEAEDDPTLQPCAAACMHARGLDCVCGCGGKNHGLGDPDGWAHGVTDSGVVEWRGRQYTCRFFSPHDAGAFVERLSGAEVGRRSSAWPRRARAFQPAACGLFSGRRVVAPRGRASRWPAVSTLSTNECFLATKSTFGRFWGEFVDIVVCAYGDKRILSLSLSINRATRRYLSARAIRQCLPPAAAPLVGGGYPGRGARVPLPSLPALWRVTSPHAPRLPLPAMGRLTRAVIGACGAWSRPGRPYRPAGLTCRLTSAH